MSWAEEDWTVGLSGRVLQKVKELQVHQERLSRENKQKQLQLDNIQTSLEKQTVKYEEARAELQCVQRELQSVRQEAKAAVTSSDRLTQELQTKQAQVCSLEGQRDAARTLNNKLTQEIKRLEAELENLQNSSRSADTTLFSTPCWNTTSPWEHNGSRKQERSEHREERPSRPLHIRQQLQFSEVGTASLPRHQNNSTPHRHPSDQSDTFSSTPLSVFPWERDDSRPASRRPSPSAPQTPCADVISKGQQEQRVYGKEKDHRTETDTSLSAVLSRVSALEEELCAKAGMLKSVQNEVVQSKKELTARELSLQKARDELSLAHTGMAQERERASGSEKRLKQLQEELKCQRQNAESSRLQHQQRSKELEKQHQRDLTELQKERQCLEKQHQQEVNKLNQELQQARTLHNALQAQADKLSLQKQALDKELDTLKEKLKWTEGQLQESQKKEAQTQAKLTEALREAESVAVSLEQSRKREQEERNQINTDIDVKEELSKKLEELKVELEELKCSREEDSLHEDKLSVANSQLTYLTLHDDDDELNSNIVCCDNKLLPSPEMNLLFCQSTNQRNILVSQATADLIQEEQTVIDPECSALEDDRQNYLKGSSMSDHKRSLSDLSNVEPAFSDLTKEVERLMKENTKERERANQYQVKLEALQSQVTCQTKQLTTAFEKQSQYISGLLVELQEKESTRLIQGEELQHYKQELDALKAEKEGAEKKRRHEKMVKVVEDGEQKKETQDERLVESLRLQANQEKKTAVNLTLTTNSLAEGDSDPQKDTDQLEIVTSDAERPTPNSDKSDSEALWSGEQHPSAQPKTQSNHDSACVMGETECGQETANMVAELLALQQENQLLKQRIEGLTVLDTRTPLLHIDGKNQEDPATQSQNTGNAALACLLEQRSLSVPNDISTDARQTLVQDAKRREDGRITKVEELEAASELQINRLQQQVEELQMRLRTLSAETQQQAGELLMWKLASQPAPTFDQFLSNTDKPSQTLDQISAVRRSQSNQQAGQVQDLYLGVQESPGSVTVVREDELFFSCTSNKLQGCMLFSRLQHSNLFEPKSPHPAKKTAALQDYDQDSAMIDKESEKDNLEINLLHQSNTCQTQHKEERDTEVIQMLSGKMGQPHATQDSHKVSGPKRAQSAECYTGNPEAKSDASKATNETNNEINKTNDSSDRYVREEMKSVSSQTEESLYPRSAPTASELHCAYTQTEEEEEEEKDEEELVKSPPVSPVPLCEGAGLGDKMLFSGSFPIPADPARLAERIRRNRTQLSAAFDDTEYEPYGLPEVVMKGFADIPSGPSCPYIVRRGLLGTTVVPVPPKDPRQEEETD
ncbi:centromere protein F isoform X3 [Etheostoma cragini]|uniref:centromere protein F isoform X3 n=1 Tax=Etheostoma cragini TaxID=417921 RepID=UPI00155EE8BB|nr:centromere protein F isoform X3 [Etheostoma cragini]